VLDQVGAQVLNLDIQWRSSQSRGYRLVSDNIMKFRYLFACWVAFSAPSLVAQAPATEESFPFVIPGLAAPPASSVVDLLWLNDRPAGGHGFVRAGRTFYRWKRQARPGRAQPC
jgi:hypothetical protein